VDLDTGGWRKGHYLVIRGGADRRGNGGGGEREGRKQFARKVGSRPKGNLRKKESVGNRLLEASIAEKDREKRRFSDQRKRGVGKKNFAKLRQGGPVGTFSEGPSYLTRARGQ